MNGIFPERLLVRFGALPNENGQPTTPNGLALLRKHPSYNRRLLTLLGAYLGGLASLESFPSSRSPPPLHNLYECILLNHAVKGKISSRNLLPSSVVSPLRLLCFTRKALRCTTIIFNSSSTNHLVSNTLHTNPHLWGKSLERLCHSAQLHFVFHPSIS